MSHIPYYGEEPPEEQSPHTPGRPKADGATSQDEDRRALRFWAAHRGAF